VTGDVAILDERAPFLEAPPLGPEEQERYFVPERATEDGTLLEHCRRAIAKGTTVGPHGLPLIGTGDWNDGLNLVGVGGRGESVWLAWFLIDVLNGFAEVLERVGQGDPDAARRSLPHPAAGYREAAKRYAKVVERAAWDGSWYRRAYFDDGTPLGSKTNEEM